MEEFELVPLNNGVISLRCLEPRETFHPGIGPEAEAQILHVDQQNLVERCLKSQDFHLWDVGLGAGANVLTAIKAFQKNLPASHPVTIQSFDKTKKPMEFALDNAEELQYLLGYESIIKELLSNGTVKLASNITWNLYGEFDSALNQGLRSPDAIFYDPYSAKGNPDMWNLDIFTKLRKTLDPERLCILTNYTASTYIRVTLLLAGFHVGIGCEIDKKNQTTIFSNHLSALKNPLDPDWLEKRVRISHSAKPLREIPHHIAPISEEDYSALQALQQFNLKS